MDLYRHCADETARLVTRAYSTSFSWATRLFAAPIRPHIYHIYGFTRLADEIVDTYAGPDRRELLDRLEADTKAAMERGYSPNLILQAFADTAVQFHIGHDLIGPFFASMRLDIEPGDYQPTDYQRYIHGSAGVVGLMCLRVFCDGDGAMYGRLEGGAAALGAALQKINFLRDIGEDHDRLGRFYFPQGSFETFDEAAKMVVVNDIERDLAMARPAVVALPSGSRLSVALAFRYYGDLLNRLRRTPAQMLIRRRVRVPDRHKLWILAGTLLDGGRL